MTTRCVAGPNIPCVWQKDLTEEISKLSKQVKEVKLEQENQIKVIRNSIKEDAKEQVLQLAGYVFSP